MEEGNKYTNKKQNNKKKDKKNNSFKMSSMSINPKNRSLFAVKKDIKYNSCKNVIVNFVPRISPKKSFCKPSLFILNPEEYPMKKLSEEEIGNNLLGISSSSSNSEGNSSDLSSSEENNKSKDKKNMDETKGNKKKFKEDENNVNINTKKDFDSELKSNADNINNNFTINNNKYNNNDSDNNKSHSILDVLLMNHK